MCYQKIHIRRFWALYLCLLIFLFISMSHFLVRTPVTHVPKLETAEPQKWNKDEKNCSSEFPDLSFVAVAAEVQLLGCRSMFPPEEFLQVDATDCGLFCTARGFKVFLTATDAEQSICVCANEMNLSRYITFGQHAANKVTFRFYHMEPKRFPSIQKNDSFIGCLKPTFDVTRLLPAWGNKNLQRSDCLHLCDKFQHPLAVSMNEKASHLTCYCFKALYELPQLATSSVANKTCANGAEVHATPWASTFCNYASLLNTTNPELPQIGLVSVPGSGNTWTRQMVQRLTGVLSGSVYDSAVAYRKGLEGELEPAYSSRTSFVKNHIFKDKDFTRDSFASLMGKFVVLIRNPLHSSIAEFNRRIEKTKRMSGITKEQFLREAKTENKFQRLFVSGKEFYERYFRLLPELNKPILVVSYEDMRDKLMLQLLRIAHFAEMDVKTASDNAVCTIFNLNQMKQATKRVYKADLTGVAASIINKTDATLYITQLNKTLSERKLHFVRAEEYLKSFEVR